MLKFTGSLVVISLLWMFGCAEQSAKKPESSPAATAAGEQSPDAHLSGKKTTPEPAPTPESGSPEDHLSGTATPSVSDSNSDSDPHVSGN